MPCAAGAPVTYAAHRGSGTALRLREAGLRVLHVPPRYGSSEESAIISLAQDGLARPMTKRQPFVRGGRDSEGRRISPAVVLNAETVWRAAQISRLGPAWFRSFGTPAQPGPRLVSVSTPAARGVVVGTAAGAPLTDLLDLAGGLAAGSRVVLVGGLGGTFVAVENLSGLLWSDADLARVGARTGPGVVEALDPRDCPLEFVDRCLTWAAGESAGQCGPCMFGRPALATDWRALAAGGDRAAYDRVRSRVGLLPGRGACRFPDGVAGFAGSALRVLADHLEQHRAGRCDAADRADGDDHTRRRLGLVRDRHLAVDRVACSGHRVCAQLLAGVTLDEWGDPVVTDDRVEAGEGRDLANTAVRLCPARALYLR